MITLAFVYIVAGLFFGLLCVLSARAARWGNSAFYALLALSMLAGNRLGDFGNGVLALVLVGIAGFGLMAKDSQVSTTPAERQGEADRRGNALFLPALIIPATALLGTLLFKQVPGLADPKQVTIIALAIGVILALFACQLWLRPSPVAPFEAGRGLLDTVGWAAVLPQMLASLGAVFALAGVGDVVGGLVGQAIPNGSLLGAVLAFGLGMALFTMIMGNAFAAFPVMSAAIGVPLLIHVHHGNPAIVCAIGMLSGFCGTLMTPMAANFNIVPAALLELRDQNAVIRAQVGTALPLLAVNIVLIYWLAFPR
jgi:uncharacterized membrane protein